LPVVCETRSYYGYFSGRQVMNGGKQPVLD
jgi:hypothetical protein